MTGAYLRVNRNDKWENIEIEYLTNEEIDEIFSDKDTKEILGWMKFLVTQLRPVAEFVDKEHQDD